jgi:membrane associated rhomboid family serine protease
MTSLTKSSSAETRHLQNSIYFPLVFCLVIFAIHLVTFENCHGVSPREFSNLWGLVTSVFLHANWQHLWSNIGPLYLLLAGVFYYFPERILVVPSIGTLLVNITVWIAARDGCHVGASGLIYFLASYLVTMAIFNRRRNLAAFVLVIVFLYGGMIWGVLPSGDNVSWESHLFGALWGIAFGIYLKKDRAWTDLMDEHVGQPQDKTEIDNAEMRIVTNDAFTSYHSNSTASMFKTSEDIDNWLNYNEIKYDFEDTSDSKNN